MEWISVEDRLPEETGPYLVYRKENPYPTTRIWVAEYWDSKTTITHWMPLPDPPKETKE